MSEKIEVRPLEWFEAVAEGHLKTFKRAYWHFIDVLLAIKDSGLWQFNHPTWESYLENVWLQRMDIGKTRIRQLEAAYSTYQMIQDVTGVTLNESQIRTLKAIVPDEYRYLLPEIASRTHAYTSSPARRHYLSTYEILLERERLKAVSIGGESHSVDITQIAVNEAILESDKRYREHIATNSKWEIVNRFEYQSASDAREAFQKSFDLQAIDTDMQIVVIVRRLKPENEIADNVL